MVAISSAANGWSPNEYFALDDPPYPFLIDSILERKKRFGTAEALLAW